MAPDFYTESLSEFVPVIPRVALRRTQKLKTHLFRTQNSNALPVNPKFGQNMAMHTLPATNFFLELISTLSVRSSDFLFLFSKTSPKLLLC